MKRRVLVGLPLIENTAMSEQEEQCFLQTLRMYPKTAAGWNQYIRDNVARKRVAKALGIRMHSIGCHPTSLNRQVRKRHFQKRCWAGKTLTSANHGTQYVIVLGWLTIQQISEHRCR
jgi:hypothetical protein